MNRLAILAILATAACRGGEDAERWRYGKILHEEEPAVASRDDARKRIEQLAARPELTLDDCYRMALHRSETLAIDGEALVRLQAQYEQMVGEVLPRLSFRGSYLRQDESGVSSSSGVQRSFTLRDRTQYEFAARQPIFSGLREFYALRQRDALYGAQEHALRHARLLLFGDAADVFYAVLQIDREAATLQNTLELAQERLEELVQRNRAGISRRSEVLAQEAEVALTRARLERTRGSIAVAWEALKFVTGLESPRTLRDLRPDPGELPPVESYTARALAERRDLTALEGQVAAAEEGIGIARAGYFPTVSLDTTYYTHREGISDEVDWDLSLSFEIPIFEGGVTQARLREARSYVREANLRIERLRRDIELQINRAYAEVKALLAELASLDKAVSSAEENYEIVQAEYRRGIVANIEVLTSFNTLEGVRLARDRARFQAKLASVRLEVQSGMPQGGAR